jgi:phytoene synthase
MTLHIQNWEIPLLAMAYEAARSRRNERPPVSYEKNLLEQAYAHSAAMTSRHSRSFFLASRLLPAPKRRAARALYAFCRTTDDLVDDPGNNAGDELCEWWDQSLSTHPASRNLVAVAWADTREQYQVPRKYAEQLILGVALDLNTTRYSTFEELSNYCYGVASTVGLMSMHIIGYTADEAIKYAVKLGVALQLTNILRDVSEDWERGRLYLPHEELNAFGVTESDIAAGRVTDNWRALMKFQIERARRLYAEAWPGIALLAPEGRLAIAAAADFYRAILDDIEAHDYDVFSRRAHVSGWGKLRRLPALWWRTRQMRFSPAATTPPEISHPALLRTQYRGQAE